MEDDSKGTDLGNVIRIDGGEDIVQYIGQKSAIEL